MEREIKGTPKNGAKIAAGIGLVAALSGITDKNLHAQGPDALPESTPTSQTETETETPEFQVRVPAGINLRFGPSTNGEVFRQTEEGETYLTSFESNDGNYEWHEILQGLEDKPDDQNVFLATNLAGVDVEEYSTAFPELLERYGEIPVGGGSGCLYYYTYPSETTTTFDIASGRSLRILDATGNTRMPEDFSTDGSLILYSEYENGHQTGFYTMRPDGSERQLIVEPESIRATQTFGAYLSPDDETIVYASNYSSRRGASVYWAATNGTDSGYLFLLPNASWVSLGGWIESQNKLIVTGERSGYWLVDVPNPRRVLDISQNGSRINLGLENGRIAHWTSDGNTFLVGVWRDRQNTNATENDRLYLLDAQAGDLTEILNYWEIADSKFSPDNKLIAFIYSESPNSRRKLALYDTTTKEVINLTNVRENFLRLLWQPATEEWNICRRLENNGNP